MIKMLLPFFLVMCTLSGISQKDSVVKYLDAELNFTDKKNVVYQALAVKAGDHWILNAWYADASLLLRASFKDAALRIKDGPFTFYYPKQLVAQTAGFKDNIPDGHWKSWYSNGLLKSEGDIVNNHYTGIWREWYKTGTPSSELSYVYKAEPAGAVAHQNSPVARIEKIIDEFSPEGVLEGPAASWYESGQQESVTSYHNDSLTGLCTWYHKNGTPSSKETYTHGKVTALECYDSAGNYTGATCSVLKLPVLIHPVYGADDYIEQELHKVKRRDIKAEGEAMVEFTVTRNGTIENLVITQSPDPALSKHIREIVAAMPAWSPAVTHNRIIDFPVKLRIPWYTNN